jgi:hypothetical protein
MAPDDTAMDQVDLSQPSDKRMRLRYAGCCRVCGVELPAGQWAIYERPGKTVRCETCPQASGQSVAAETQVPEPQLSTDERADDAPAHAEFAPGVPGASARREHERRRANREADVRAKHPRIGGLILALQSDPQSTTAWATGAEGEEKIGARLNAIASDNVRVLHDRRIPKTRANIDHVVVCPTGVMVIDAKKYKGRPLLRVDGGFLRPRTETLMVGSRNCDKLVDGVLRQVELVVDADWPLIGGSFTTRGVEALWQKRALTQMEKPGPLGPDLIADVHSHLAASFPPA